MQTHPRKKIELVVEAVHVPAVTALLERLGVPGYTVLPVIAGKGHQGLRRAGDPAGLGDSAMIVVIASDAVAGRVLDEADAILRDRMAIIAVSDVRVLRGDHF